MIVRTLALLYRIAIPVSSKYSMRVGCWSCSVEAACKKKMRRMPDRPDTELNWISPPTHKLQKDKASPPLRVQTDYY
jgi:hypothetical protein